MSNGIRIKIILEMVGGPKDYLESALKSLIAKLKEHYKVVDEKVHEAIETKEPKGLWSTFAEVELLLEGIDSLVSLCFDYMPSSIDILEPLNFNVKAKDLMDMLNDLTARLHQYDMFIKNLRAENMLLKGKEK